MNTLDKMKEINVNAAAATTRMVTGTTATNLLMEKFIKRMPFLSRVFKGDSIRKDPLARLAVSQVALGMQIHLAPDNKKLGYVAESMVEANMAEVVLTSKVLKDLTKELENLVP